MTTRSGQRAVGGGRGGAAGLGGVAADAGVDELIAMLEGRSEAIARLEGGGLEVEPMRLCQKQGEGAEDGAEGLEDADDAAYVEGEEEEEDDDDDE